MSELEILAKQIEANQRWLVDRLDEICRLIEHGPTDGWKLKIASEENGYKLRWKDYLDDGSEVWREAYIVDDEADKLKSGEELLWGVMDHFSFGGSKHDAERLRIVREKRDDG